MAEVITKFKLETTQYDSALRDAAKGLATLTDKLTVAGKDFDKFAQKSVEQARALGQIESGATNVKDKLRDLVSAYNNVAKAYNNLTNEQKQTDFGKAMAQSLQELQGRITSTKREVEELKNGTQSTGNILDQLAAKFGMSTKALTTWGTALGAGAAALKVAKDAFFASEQNLDDWNRMVYTSQSTYEAFLTSLNTGDISGFLDRIGQITQAAFDAYNAIDRLQTMKNIQSPRVAQKQAEVQRMETMLRTGRYVAPVDGRPPIKGMESGDILTDTQKKQIADNLAKAVNEIATLTKNEVTATTDAINKLYREQALRLGMSNEEFKKGTASMAAFDSAIEKARKYQEFEAQHTTRTQMNTSAGVITQNVRDNAVNPYERYKNWSVFKDDGKLYQEIVNLIKQRSQQESQYYGEFGRAYRGINRAEGVKPYGGGATTKLTDPEKAQEKYDQSIKDYNQALEQAKMEVDAGRLNAAEAKKKELAAEEALWKAIGDAREIYDNPKFQEEQAKVADKVKSLGGSVNALIEEQKKAQEAARQLAAAQKKLSDAQTNMADALNANDYKAYTAAYQQYNQANAEVQRLQPKQFEPVTYEVEARTESALDAIREVQDITIEDKTLGINVNTDEVTDAIEEVNNVALDDKEMTITVTANTQEAVDALRGVDGIILTPKVVDVKVNTDNVKEAFTYTENNMEAFIRRLHTHLANADLGSELYKNLTAQLADAQTLANLLQVAVKNGIDIAQFDPQTLFNKIFGENPGDYIENQDWTAIQDKINEELAKMDIAPIKINFETGEISTNKSKDGQDMKNGDNALKKITGNMSTITGALQQLGVEVPEGFQKTLGVMQVITTILMAIQSLAAISATTSALKAIPVIGWFLHNGGVVHAANGFNGVVPGNKMSGDQVPAMLDSGEVVLNRAQQGNLLSQLQGGGTDYSGVGETRVESDQMVLLLRNGASRRGMTIGEYLGL